MNILLINHYAGSNLHGMEYRPFYLAREWVNLGHRVTIVAASFSHLRSSAPEITGSMTEAEISGIHYVWLKTPRYEGNGIKRVINIFAFLFQLYRFQKKIIDIAKPNVVIASSTYPLDIYPAYSISRKTGAKLIFEVHDLWPLSPIELGGMSPKHPFIILLQYAENFAYRNADRVVSILPKTSSYMQEHGMAEEKFVYIPNGIDQSEWYNNSVVLPELHQKTILQLHANGQFIICYAGAHGIANALNNLVQAARLLKDQPITFLLVGQGPEKEQLQKDCESINLSNMVFLPSVPKRMIPLLLKQCDALYIGLQSQPLFRFGVCPNKLLDYMMAAKPVIYAINAGNNPVMECGCGLSVPPENPEALAKAAVQMMKMSDKELEEMGQRGRLYIEKEHNYKILAEKFIQMI